MNRTRTPRWYATGECPVTRPRAGFDDESRDKLPFFAARGVKEIWLADPETRKLEVYVLRGAAYFAALPDRRGLIHAPALDLELSIVDGPKLRIAWANGTVEI